MKRIFILIWFFVLNYSAVAQVGFNKAEYFFDSDPGVGLGTALTTPAGTSDTINFTSSISTISLPAGFHFLGVRVRHNDGKWGLFEKRGFYVSSATADAANISAAEYFFDTDPGTGLGTVVSPPPNGAVVNFSVIIPTSLPAGFHFLAIRTKGTDGIWGLFEKRGFYISSSTADAANISAAEYFFDADPGVGLGTAVSPSPNGAVVNFTATIPTSLPSGFHFLAIRVKGTDGIWGLYEKRGFYISSSTADAANISAAEYFFDSDPGVGMAAAISPSPNGSVVNFTATIPTSLSTGFHFLAIRVKGSDGKWGLFEKRGFYVSSATANVANISAAEYFFDSDPGVGLGTSVTPAPNGAVVNFTALLPTSLAPGFHFVALRTRGSDGVWGLFEKRGFYVSTATANMPIITNAEYFFDTDPGVGLATAISVNTPGDNFTQTFPIPVPGTFIDGSQHALAIRVKDQEGVWGLFEYRLFDVSGTVPVTGLYFNAKKEITTVRLDWYTLTESNTSHFEIERSLNGRIFEKTGQKQSAGNSTSRTDYTFTDASPKSMNYYRLKQVDRDDNFIYSDIRVVKFGKEQYTVYPVITPGRFTITGVTEKINVKLFNSNGQLFRSTTSNTSQTVVDITNAAAGTYYLVLEKNGELLFSQKIIKE